MLVHYKPSCVKSVMNIHRLSCVNIEKHTPAVRVSTVIMAYVMCMQYILYNV